MKLCWLIPNDRGGGIASVAISCCRQAAQVGHDVTLLMIHEQSSWIGDNHNFKALSLGLRGAAQETPGKLLQWLKDNPQDVLFLNGCGQADFTIPYLFPSVRCVYVVHDTAPIYWRKAVSEENDLDAIVAVSQTVARKFIQHLKQPDKLSVILNGCNYPTTPSLTNPRADDLIFLGGEDRTKGSLDALRLWRRLVKSGFSGSLHWFGKVGGDFQDKINMLPERSRIHIYGRVNRELIFSTAATAKVLLMLSRAESFSMSTIETMSMGCIPVAWDINIGTKEIFTSDQTGLVAPLGNINFLARQVFRACEDYSVFQSDVIERARLAFDESVMWNAYQSLINKVISHPSVARSKRGLLPPVAKPPIHRFQLLPSPIRMGVRNLIGRFPRLGYWLRDLRGW